MADNRIRVILETVNESKGTEDFKKQFEASMKSIMTAVAGVTAGVVVLKQAFNLAQEGANVGVLRQSIQSLGVDMEGIIEASKQTVSGYDAMSATATILAGTQGDLKQAFIDNAAHLMEIAKAANTVNPALGDTSYLYESLARGIKRSSPLILDNLGLVVKVGEANEIYAKQLGKSVDALTAEEKQMALLNATIEAGNVLIDQAAGVNTDMADAYARVQAELKDATIAGKEWLAKAILPTITGIRELITWQERLNALYAETTDRVFDTSESYDEYVIRMLKAADAAGKTQIPAERLIEIYEEEGVLLPALAKEYGILTAEQYDLMKMSEGLKGVLDNQVDITEDLTYQTELAAAATWDWGGAIASVTGNLQDLNPNISSTVDKYLELIDFSQAGGEGLQRTIENLVSLADNMAIPMDVAKVFFADAKAELMALNGASTKEITDALLELGVPASMVESYLANINGQVDLLNGQTIDIYVNIHTSGSLPKMGTGGQGSGNKEKPAPIPQAAGGPVFAGQSYFVGEQGTELFTPNSNGIITPNADLRGGMGSGITNNFYGPVTVTADAPEADIMGMRTS